MQSPNGARKLDKRSPSIVPNCPISRPIHQETPSRGCRQCRCQDRTDNPSHSFRVAQRRVSIFQQPAAVKRILKALSEQRPRDYRAAIGNKEKHQQIEFHSNASGNCTGVRFYLHL